MHILDLKPYEFIWIMAFVWKMCCVIAFFDVKYYVQNAWKFSAYSEKWIT